MENTITTAPRNLTESGLDLDRINRLVDEKLAAWEAAGCPPPVVDELLHDVKLRFLDDVENKRCKPVAHYNEMLAGDENAARRADFAEFYTYALAMEALADGEDEDDYATGLESVATSALSA